MKAERPNAASLSAMPAALRAKLLRTASEADAIAMLGDWSFWSRPEQLAPAGDWRVWLMMAGRGFGKTRAGAEWVRGIAEADRKARIALVGATMAEARAVMVEGESGLLAIAPPERRPRWEPSLHRLRWPSGAVATLHSASEPEGLRGPQFSHAWCDEIGKWPFGIATWDNLAMALRLGEQPRIVATTTPRPVPLLRALVTRDDVVVARGRTIDNREHLSADFLGRAPTVRSACTTMIGGPIGGAIGAVIGNQVDRSLFTPKGAKGARLDSLAVQGSSYGSDLPRLFGTMRLSGSVIWATDLKEAKHKSGGKGRPTTTSYSYSASFAVTLSARPIRAVHRIWADGDLLRGAAGDWKGDVGAFRIHLGDEAQEADPLIAATEGIDAAPAHRGLAYVVFEDLQLADYGNRIPSLSFEVEADAGPVSLATIATTLSDGDVTGSGGPLLGGYAAAGDSLRGAIEGLASALPVAFADGPVGVVLVDESTAPFAIDAGELGTTTDDKPAPKLAIDRQAAGTLNEALTISYYDPALDYQLGSQSARRETSARRAGTVELAASVDASTARGIVEARLAREWAGRTTASMTLPWRRLDLGAGALVTLPGQQGRWRVTERAFEAMGLTLTAQRLAGPSGASPPASAGSGLPQLDLPQGPTTLALLDLPSLGDDLATAPTLLIAAAGTSAGWRRANVMASLDEGASWQPIDQTAPAAVIGRAVSALAPAGAAMRDMANSVDIELLNDAMTLAGSDATGTSATANLALLGDELIQFATAEQLGPRLFRLGGLLRGRRGSEWAIAGHAVGDRFVLIDSDTVLPWTVPAAAIGTTVRISAMGTGDDVPVEQSILFQARALRPPSPVAVSATPQPDGGLQVRWTRRSRLGWPWLDNTDAPLGEEGERYQLAASRSGGTSLFLTVLEPEAILSAAMLASVGGSGPLTIRVAQIGTTAASLLPATIII